MTIKEFKDYVKTGRALDTDDIHVFMDEMSDAALRITFRLNAAYHTKQFARQNRAYRRRRHQPVARSGECKCKREFGIRKHPL